MSRFVAVRERLLAGTHLPIALYLGVIGLMFALSPSTAMTDPLPLWEAWAWMASFVGGAGLIVYGTASERSRVESVGHAFHLFGLGLFVALLAIQGAEQGVALAALSAVSLMRMRTLKRSRRAKREARRIIKEGL
jgi:hypothetical protein